MIFGIGTDIVRIERIQTLVERYGDRFVGRILSASEIAVFAKHQNNIAFLAKRFAAKEAVAKAFGCGIGQDMAFTEISVINTSSGKPCVELLGKAKQFASRLNIRKIEISLSDERDFALAFVVIEQ
jgi:holo-[acyl-carrier protein] synthase